MESSRCEEESWPSLLMSMKKKVIFHNKWYSLSRFLAELDSSSHRLCMIINTYSCDAYHTVITIQTLVIKLNDFYYYLAKSPWEHMWTWHWELRLSPLAKPFRKVGALVTTSWLWRWRWRAWLPSRAPSFALSQTLCAWFHTFFFPPEITSREQVRVVIIHPIHHLWGLQLEEGNLYCFWCKWVFVPIEAQSGGGYFRLNSNLFNDICSS